MSRQIKKDFEDLCRFVQDYNLKDIVSNREAREHLSACHKKYYAYLIIIEEFRLVIEDARYSPQLTAPQFAYIQESCSDVGQSLFLTINGCYKGSRLLLRSSIENFLKGISFDEDDSIVTTKSVYEVFDKAKLTTAFSGGKISIHQDLHNIYTTLCQDVHTADTNHMASISALNHFPKYDSGEFNSIQNLIKRLVNNYITVLSLKFNQHYHHIGYMNKEILNSEVKREYKKEVQNVN